MELKYMTTAGTLTVKGGTFTGVANRANFRDYGDDVVESMAWTKGESPMRVPLLAQHEAKDVIGRAELREDPSIGLVITKGVFADGVTLAEDYKKLVAGGFIDGVSVGYSVIDGYRGRDGARHLTALKLHEVSIVTFPMNALSRVTSISDAKQLEEIVAAIRRTRLRMVERHGADESAAARMAALLKGMAVAAEKSKVLVKALADERARVRGAAAPKFRAEGARVAREVQQHLDALVSLASDARGLESAFNEHMTLRTTNVGGRLFDKGVEPVAVVLAFLRSQELKALLRRWSNAPGASALAEA